uniref:periplasmic heavy metal sensor n=1 Tax=Yoonia sp. TaxID=2212373 RepID=UPI00404842CA
MGDAITKPSRMWRTVLVLSLALNVAVIGGAVGIVISGRAHDGPPPRMSFDFGPLGRVLEPNDRRAIGQAMRKRGAQPLDHDEVSEKVADLAMELRAEPFDADAVAQIMGTFRLRSEKIQQDAQVAFLARLAAMTPQARAALADRLENGGRRSN